MKPRASYHTSLKQLIHLDLMPHQYAGRIPRSNIHRWRREAVERYVGSDLNVIADTQADLIKTVNQYPRMFHAYGRLIKTLIKIISSADDFKAIVREQKKVVVDAILRTKDIVPIVKAVRVFNISRETFYSWVIDVKLKCDKSFFKRCNRIYPNQIIPSEVLAIKKALKDVKHLHWPIRSVHLHGLRTGAITVSENTMYKVNRLLGIRNTRKNRKVKKRHKEGIRASAPNEIWHTDITTLKTLDGKRYYIYLVMDNFSRYILSYAISDKVSGQTTARILEKAYLKASKLSEELNVDLIVDGGPENNNIYVNEFINQSRINMRKLVALKDIDYSNSMIESVNKTLKYSYLFPKETRDYKHLKRTMKYSIKDFCEVRPHGQLKGLTPFESYHKAKLPENFRNKLLKKARKERYEYNKENQCHRCIAVM